VLFVLGKREGILGFIPKIPYLDDEDEQIAWDKKDGGGL
jgi:hypothetical protein